MTTPADMMAQRRIDAVRVDGLKDWDNVDKKREGLNEDEIFLYCSIRSQESQ